MKIEIEILNEKVFYKGVWIDFLNKQCYFEGDNKNLKFTHLDFMFSYIDNRIKTNK